jgi:hypothetical protein
MSRRMRCRCSVRIQKDALKSPSIRQEVKTTLSLSPGILGSGVCPRIRRTNSSQVFDEVVWTIGADDQYDTISVGSSFAVAVASLGGLAANLFFTRK